MNKLMVGGSGGAKLDKSAIKHCNYAVITMLHGGIFRLAMVLGVCALITVFLALPVGADELDDLANQIKDPNSLETQADVCRVRDENDKAIVHYLAASKLKNSATIQVKLGQSYQALGDSPRAIASYKKAMTMPLKDVDVRNALIS